MAWATILKNKILIYLFQKFKFSWFIHAKFLNFSFEKELEKK